MPPAALRPTLLVVPLIGGVSRFTTMPRVSYELRSQSRSSRLVRRPIARSARCGIDARLFVAERGSSGSTRRSRGDDRHDPLQSRLLFSAFSQQRETSLSKYATDDRGQKNRCGGQEQSGNNFFFSEQRRVEQPACQVDGADRIWRTAISTTRRRWKRTVYNTCVYAGSRKYQRSAGSTSRAPAGAVAASVPGCRH